MDNTERIRENILEEIGFIVRSNEHLIPLTKEDIDNLYGSIYVTGTDERITSIGDMDVESFSEKALEEFYYTFDELPIETLEAIKETLENMVIESEKTAKRCQD